MLDTGFFVGRSVGFIRSRMLDMPVQENFNLN
jgi:hypothetical protein